MDPPPKERNPHLSHIYCPKFPACQKKKKKSKRTINFKPKERRRPARLQPAASESEGHHLRDHHLQSVAPCKEDCNDRFRSSSRPGAAAPSKEEKSSTSPPILLQGFSPFLRPHSDGSRRWNRSSSARRGRRGKETGGKGKERGPIPSAVVHSPWSYGVGAAVVLVVYRKSVWGWGTEGPFDSQNTSPTYLTTLGAFSLKVRT
ncbi:hypothetical protein GW17_00011229 [Ensete ventricosum]|nr:hypothetical protein GW17_00011229 [Ensete ventricosum]